MGKKSEVGKSKPFTTMDSMRLQHAEGYLELQLPRPALKELSAASMHARASFEWNLLMGEAMRAMELHEDAICFLDNARLIKPEHIPSYISLGWCLKRSNKLQLAIEALHCAERMCRRQKDEALALVHYNLSCYYSLAGKKQQMLHWLGTALRSEPKFRKSIATEPDFDPYRDDVDFQILLRLIDSPVAAGT